MTLRQNLSDIPLYMQILLGMIAGIVIGRIALQDVPGDAAVCAVIDSTPQLSAE